ncbi:MAG: hypothetical protein GXP27_17250, partial [Planctomycetes bacterium]|nr:hypothetical protein [Planctomycetota bacterium]
MGRGAGAWWIGAIWVGTVTAAFGAELGVRGSQFTIDGRPTFLCGLSYYGALGASREFIRQDLDDMQEAGFNWLRVWATWSAFGNNVSAVDDQGRVRQPFLDQLKWLLAECDRRGLIVDVTVTRGEGRLGNAHVPTLEAHRRALTTLSVHLRSWRNWYLDLANEHNIRSKYVSFEDARALRDAVKQTDPKRLVTLSYIRDCSKEDLRRYLFTVKVDFLSPHRPRNRQSPGQTASVTRQYLDWMRAMGRIVPVHYQEPFRRDFSKGWQPTVEDFLLDLRGALRGGAAGWCFHNGDNRWAKDGRPRRSFDMRQQRLFDQLDPVERQVVAHVGSVLREERRPLRRPNGSTGPLRVHPENPRYFADASGRVVYLAGSHTWLNLQDATLDGKRLPFDYDEFLGFLQKHNHNFFRLWTWESPSWVLRDSRVMTVSPLPFQRTGPGTARDGKPKFDLTRFNRAYFQRLRERVEAAGRRGLYVGVMLFQGFSVARKSKTRKRSPWETHPFNGLNNINGIDGDLNGDGEGYEVHTLSDPRITRLQETYVRQVIDTLNDLDHVIYEISNESHGASAEWQAHMIRFIHEYEKGKPKQHPVWMSYTWDGLIGRGTNADLFASPAEAISPHQETCDRDGQDQRYRDDPPVADGRKVIITDTDHLWGIGGNASGSGNFDWRGLGKVGKIAPGSGTVRCASIRR